MTALHGIRVLDFSRVLAGPYCTMMLGDLGADVVKVERPHTGDDTRDWGPPFLDGQSAYYLCCIRNKRSMVLDLSTSDGLNLARQLAAAADVVVENFRVGWMAEHGLGYEALSATNPGLVYASISGYGQSGPDAHLPGYDFLIQARGGLMSITGEADGEPLKVGVATADITTGLFCCSAILAALFARQHTGRGQRVELSLLDCQVAALANVGSSYLVSGEPPARHGNAHPSIVPYQMFRAADGPLALAVGNDAQFQRCCEVLGRPEWGSDPRFATNPQRVRHRDTLIPLMEAVLATNTVAHWLAGFRTAGVPADAVQDVPQVFADPQVIARSMREEVPRSDGSTVPLVASPLNLSGTPTATRRPPPRLGEHTEEVLAEWLNAT